MPTNQITTLPIAVDETLLKDGLAAAALDRLSASLLNAQEMVREMRQAVVARDGFDATFARIDRARAAVVPVLEYADAFLSDEPAPEPEDAPHD